MATPARRRPARGALVAEATSPCLAAALRELDRVLAAAVEQQSRRLGPQSLLDPWRGLHLEPAEARRLANAGAPVAAPAGVAEQLAAPLRRMPALRRMDSAREWTALDLALWLLVLAPELDLRYEGLYGYLQDDLTRRRPSADLLANLLAASPDDRADVIARLAPDAALRRHGLIEPAGDAGAPWLARAWHPDALWQHWLLGHAMPDLPPAWCARVVQPCADELAWPEDEPALSALKAGKTLPRLLLHGPHGAGKLRLAGALAAQRQQRLLIVDLHAWCSADQAQARAQAGRLLRAAALFGWLPYLHGATALAQADPQALRAVIEVLADQPDAGFVLVSTMGLPALHAAPLAARRLAMEFPSAPRRTLLWQRALQSNALAAPHATLVEIGTRFVLSAAQIEQAALDARMTLGPPLQAVDPVDRAALCAAARQQSGADLASVAQRLSPRAGFDALVTVPEVQNQLREICTRVATREAVRRDWSGTSVHGRGQGVTALFVGPSGTGKTLSAEALACELGLDLFRIDLAGIVSKYIGETEKNLDRVFCAAEHANAVLFFDEADALFGKRSEVKDAHDRYANIEVSYLLQKMEQFDGLAILATNLRQNLDEAFARRLTFTLNFPFPEEPERHRLWEQLWPPRAPRARDVDLAWFAHEYRLSGGHIRNTVMAAAHLAAADGQVITRAHLLHATRREFQKLGKTLAASDGGRA